MNSAKMGNEKMKCTLSITLLLLPLLFCCSPTDMERQFEMERAINRANRLKQQFYLTDKNLDAIEYDRLIDAFSAITRMIPAPPDDSAAVRKAPEPVLTSWQMAGLAYYNLGLLKMDKGDYEGAYDDLAELIRSYGFKPHQVQTAMFLQAMARYKQKRFPEAVAIYNKVAQYYIGSAPSVANPNLDALDSPLTAARILRDSGESARLDSQLQSAVNYYWNILTMYQGTPLADAAVGKLASAFLMGELADSAIVILSAVKDPESGMTPPLVLFNIATIQKDNLNNFAGAERSYREFINNYPDHYLRPSAELGIGASLLARGKYRAARDELSRLEKLKGVPYRIQAEASYLKGLSFEKENDWQRALGEFDYLQTNYPISDVGMETPIHIAEYYQSRGESKLAAEAFTEAEKDYRKMIDMYAARKDVVAAATSYLAGCAVLRGNWTEAVDILRTLATRYPDTPEGFSAIPKAAEISITKLDRPAEAATLLRIFANNYPRTADIDKIIAYADSLERSAR